MSNVLIDDNKLKVLADSMRQLMSSDGTMTIKEMVDNIKPYCTLIGGYTGKTCHNIYGYACTQVPFAKSINNKCVPIAFYGQNDFTDATKQVVLECFYLNEDYSDYLSFENGIITILKELDALVIGTAYNYDSAGNPPNGKFTINDSVTKTYQGSSSDYRAHGSNSYSGKLYANDIIKYYTTSSRGYPHQFGSIWKI